MVYPGARSSVRFERLREGIADVEKIRVLQKLLAAGTPVRGIDELEGALRKFTYAEVQNTPAADAVNAGKRVLDELGR